MKEYVVECTWCGQTDKRDKHSIFAELEEVSDGLRICLTTYCYRCQKVRDIIVHATTIVPITKM